MKMKNHPARKAWRRARAINRALAFAYTETASAHPMSVAGNRAAAAQAAARHRATRTALDVARTDTRHRRGRDRYGEVISRLADAVPEEYRDQVLGVTS